MNKPKNGGGKAQHYWGKKCNTVKALVKLLRCPRQFNTFYLNPKLTEITSDTKSVVCE